NRLQLALQLNQRTQQEQLEHLERVRGQQDLILRLARQRYSAENSLLEAAQLITQSACEIYKVDNASIWHLEDQRLEPITAWYRGTPAHRHPEAIDASLFPVYLEALHTSRAIDAHNADPFSRTRALTQSMYPLTQHVALAAAYPRGHPV